MIWVDGAISKAEASTLVPITMFHGAAVIALPGDVIIMSKDMHLDEQQPVVNQSGLQIEMPLATRLQEMVAPVY